MGDKDEGLESEDTSLDEDNQLMKTSETGDINIENDNEQEKILVEDFKSFLNVDVTLKVNEFFQATLQ